MTAAPNQCAPASVTSPWAEGLTTGVDPVIDEQHLISGLHELLREAEGEVTVSVIRWGRALPPRVAVGGGSFVLADFDHADAQSGRDETAQQHAAGLGPEDDRWPRIGEEAGKRGPEGAQNLRVPPPSRDVRPATPVCTVPSPTEARDQPLAKWLALFSAATLGLGRCKVPLHGSIVVEAPKKRRFSRSYSRYCRPCLDRPSTLRTCLATGPWLTMRTSRN
jgi:hypothetical protein